MVERNAVFLALLFVIVIGNSTSAETKHLPPSVQIDLMVTNLERAIRSDDHPMTLEIIEQVRSLDASLISGELLYFKAIAEKESGDFASARDSINEYLVTMPRATRTYQHALEIALELSELPSDHYRIVGINNDIVQDVTTGLEWQRCSLGQKWDGNSCTGEAARYTWGEARAAANRVSGWRLPSIEELRSLVYCSSGQPAYFKNNDSRCEGEYQRPTIVAEAFPNTTIDYFWSGSPHAYGSIYAWNVGFRHGFALGNSRSVRYRVRLVRDAQ